MTTTPEHVDLDALATTDPELFRLLDAVAAKVQGPAAFDVADLRRLIDCHADDLAAGRWPALHDALSR